MTRWPVCAMATARFATVVLFPSPGLVLEISSAWAGSSMVLKRTLVRNTRYPSAAAVR